VYSVTFGGTVPRHLLLSLRGDQNEGGRGRGIAPDANTDADADATVGVVIRYSRPSRLRVYRDGTRVEGARLDCDTGKLRVNLTGSAVYEIETTGETTLVRDNALSDGSLPEM
jgi:hypothetical protein